MPVSKAQQKAVNKYIGANYDIIRATLPKGRKADIESWVKQQGHASVSAYINHLIRTDMGIEPEDWKKAGE